MNGELLIAEVEEGIRRYGLTAILTNTVSLRWDHISNPPSDPDDTEFLETWERSVDAVLALHGVPCDLKGIWQSIEGACLAMAEESEKDVDKIIAHALGVKID